MFLAAIATANTRTRDNIARTASFILRRAAVGANFSFARVRDLALSDEPTAFLMLAAAKGGTARVLHDFYKARHGFGLVMTLRGDHWLAYVPLITIGGTIITHSMTS